MQYSKFPDELRNYKGPKENGEEGDEEKGDGEEGEQASE